MRLKLLSPGEMSEDQKQTYDESIAGKRGKPPAADDGLAQQPGDGRGTPPGWAVSCASIRCFPRPSPRSRSWSRRGTGPPHYEWYAHKLLALKGGLDPKIIDDIRDRRTPTFDDPKARIVYDVSKSLHEGHGPLQVAV